MNASREVSMVLVDFIDKVRSNDTLVFYDASKEHLEVLRWAFMWFEAVFELKINLHKSELIHVGKAPNFEELSRVSGCKLGPLPSCYLGLPLRATFKSPRVWDIVEERFQKQLIL